MEGCCRFLWLGISFFLLLTYLPINLHAQSSSEFLNLDCGFPKGSTYTERRMVYTSDSEYIDTGESWYVSSTYSAGYNRNAQYLRSFPNGTRNCYSLRPFKKGGKYLIRAKFLYGNYDGLNKTPVFDLHIGVNYWDSIIGLSTASDYIYSEALTVVASSSLYVCLVNIGKGTPFISAIEVRPLPDDFYDQANSSHALRLFYRADFGGVVTYRYPDDVYDRYWTSFTSPRWRTINGTVSSSVSTSSFQPPPLVMMTASTPTSGSSMNFSWNYSQLWDERLPYSSVFIAMHFAELISLNSSTSRIFDIYINNELWSQDVKPVYLEATTASNSSRKYDSIDVSLISKGGSTLPPILNAVEVYRVLDFSTLETDVADATAIVEIKSFFKLKRNWMGDPCAPEGFVWQGLNCSNSNESSLRIISLNLSSSGLIGEIPASLGKLAQLQSLDLSGNQLTGGIPDFLATLLFLKFLDLTGNNFSGSVPKDLQDKVSAGKLTLRFDQTSAPGTEHKRHNITIIIVAIGGSLGLLILVIVCLCYAWKWRRNMKSGKGKPMIDVNPEIPEIPRYPFSMETKRYRYNELERITGKFATVIGKGGFGSVYHGTIENDREVAIKVLSMSSFQGVRQFQNEVLLLSKIHHKNLVSLFGYCDDPHHLALVYEYMEEGSLHDYLFGKDSHLESFGWRKRLEIAVGAAQGLEYLHDGCKPSIVHRDVKPHNILLNREMETKIADFGLSRLFESDMHSYVSTIVMGTPGYLDPEYSNTERMTQKSDVYSFGIVLLQLATRLPAIIKRNENQHIVEWALPRYERGAIEEILDKGLHDSYEVNSAWRMLELALECASPASSERPSMSEVVIHLKECLDLERYHGRKLNQNQHSALSGNAFSIEASPPNLGTTSLLPK